MRDEGVLADDRLMGIACLMNSSPVGRVGWDRDAKKHARPLPLCFCRNPMTFSSTVVLSIFRVLPGSMELSSLMRTLNWSRRFFSDLFREALEIHKAQVN